MQPLLGIVAALSLSPLPVQQTSTDPIPPPIRCFVSAFRGAATPEGATATMTVVSNGTPCAVNNFGNPDLRQNPASSIAITAAPLHGTVESAAPRVLYKAETGYIGDDVFTYEARAQYPNGDPMTMRVRVKVAVVAAAFSRPQIPVRVGGSIPPPRRIKDVKPVLPPEARAAGVTGVVVVEATIGADGKVGDMVVRRSIPLLDSAALDAVRQWEFAPTTINGRAVPVMMTVSVNFALQPAASIPLPQTAPPPAAAAGAANRSPLPPIATAGLERTSDPDLEQGRQALERRQYEDALRIFKRASDAHSKRCADCFYGMALAYEGLGAAKNVVESCDRAIELAADSPALLVHVRQSKGLALQTLGEYKDAKRLQEAEAEFRSALAIDPDAAYLRFHLGVVLMQEHRDDEGTEELKRELTLRPKSVHSDLAARLIANPRRAREAYAPDFSLITLSREFVELGDFRGKVVVLDFWGTWCPPCVKAVPQLRDFQKKHANDPFALIGISSDSDERVLRDFVAKQQADWIQYWDRDRKIQNAYEVRAWPTYIVIDDEGIVRLRTMGTSSAETARLEDEVKRLLKAANARHR